jgi:hypothetical protein
MGCSYGPSLPGTSGNCTADPFGLCFSDDDCTNSTAEVCIGLDAGADCSGTTNPPSYCSRARCSAAPTIACNLLGDPLVECFGGAVGACVDGTCSAAPTIACNSTGADANNNCFGGAIGTCDVGFCGPAVVDVCDIPSVSTEFASLMGAAAIPGPTAPSEKAFIHSARLRRGDLFISFETHSELADLVGFEVLRVDKKTGRREKVNDGIIPRKGENGAGAFYEVYVPRGRFKNSRTFHINSVFTDGSGILSDPASF